MEVFGRGDLGDEVFDAIDLAVRERLLDNGAVFFSTGLPPQEFIELVRRSVDRTGLLRRRDAAGSLP